MKILAIFIILIGIYIVYLKNKAINWDLKVENSWTKINIQIKKKINIIPNLLEIFNEYVDYEKNIITRITLERQNLINSSTKLESLISNKLLEDNLNILFNISENCFDLNSNETYIRLQREITECDKMIETYIIGYNDNIVLYNKFILGLPQKVILNIFGYTEIELLDLNINDN